MSADINKPTGRGYSSAMRRKCGECGHEERMHYGTVCYEPPAVPVEDLCFCHGFTARVPTAEEKAITEVQRATEKELEFVGEVLYEEVKRASRIPRG